MNIISCSSLSKLFTQAITAKILKKKCSSDNLPAEVSAVKSTVTSYTKDLGEVYLRKRGTQQEERSLG